MSDKLATDDINYVRDLVRKNSAMQFDEGKDYLIELRIGELAREAGFASSAQLVASARAGQGGIGTRLVEAMAIHETSFFRDLHPFDALRLDVLPALAAARARTRSLTLWSAACSSGQEPYTMAIMLLEHFPELASWPVRIIATDFSEKVLAKAREGRYSQMDVNRGLPAHLLVKYFVRAGLDWVISDRVRNMVEFKRVNLLDASYPVTPDVVFLRNVLIYFDTPTKRTILERLRQVLRPDGALFLGGSETTLGIDDHWERVTSGKAAFYRGRT